MVDGVTPRSPASSATLARPSARSCSTRRARRSVSRMHGSCANTRALSTLVREPRTSGRLRARKLRTGTRDAYDAADGLPAWRRSRPGRVQLAERHLHGAGPRPPPEPAQGAASGGSRVGDRRRDGRLQARRRPRARHHRDRRPARPGDRRRAGDRRRVAARPRRPDRGRRGDRLRGRERRAREPRPARLGRGQDQAPRRLGRQAPRLLPPGRPERRRAGAARRARSRPPAGPRTSRCSWSRCRSGSTAGGSRARTAAGSWSRPRVA